MSNTVEVSDGENITGNKDAFTCESLTMYKFYTIAGKGDEIGTAKVNLLGTLNLKNWPSLREAKLYQITALVQIL